MSLLNLGIDPGNIISLFTLLSPFFISTFLIFFGALQGSLSGLFWLIGVIIAQWGVGFFLVRTFIAERSTRNMHIKYSKLIKSMSPQEAYNQLKGKSSSRAWWTKKEGSGANFKDMCSLFLQPYDNSIYSQFSMPSLNTIFLVFTIIYSALCGFVGGGEDNTQSLSTTLFIMSLTVIFILNAFSLLKKKCNTAMDIAVGTLIGGIFGTLWYFIGSALDKSLYPNKGNSILFFKHKFVPKGASKCSVEQQAFRCEIDDSGFPLPTDEEEDDE